MNELCVDALSSIERANEALKARDAALFFAELSRFLSQTARVSRFLWPGAPGGSNKQEKQKRKSRATKRADFLRHELGVNDDHALRQRALRDLLEHLDEQIDEWAETSTHHNFIDTNIGPASFIGGSTVTPGDIFRMYNPKTKMAHFRGHDYNIQELASGLSELASRIQRRQIQRPAA
jgi:hypothetical protein